jgi:hypothetical protein
MKYINMQTIVAFSIGLVAAHLCTKYMMKSS